MILLLAVVVLASLLSTPRLHLWWVRRQKDRVLFREVDELAARRKELERVNGAGYDE